MDDAVKMEPPLPRPAGALEGKPGDTREYLRRKAILRATPLKVLK